MQQSSGGGRLAAVQDVMHWLFQGNLVLDPTKVIKSKDGCSADFKRSTQLWLEGENVGKICVYVSVQAYVLKCKHVNMVVFRLHSFNGSSGGNKH